MIEYEIAGYVYLTSGNNRESGRVLPEKYFGHHYSKRSTVNNMENLTFRVIDADETGSRRRGFATGIKVFQIHCYCHVFLLSPA